MVTTPFFYIIKNLMVLPMCYRKYQKDRILHEEFLLMRSQFFPDLIRVIHFYNSLLTY